MEIVVTISLLIVPVLAAVSLFMSIRNAQRVKALKGLVTDLSKLISNPGMVRQQSPVEQAMQSYNLNAM